MKTLYFNQINEFLLKLLLIIIFNPYHEEYSYYPCSCFHQQCWVRSDFQSAVDEKLMDQIDQSWKQYEELHQLLPPTSGTCAGRSQEHHLSIIHTHMRVRSGRTAVAAISDTARSIGRSRRRASTQSSQRFFTFSLMF